jgi:phospholipid N-methyltransferase
MLSEYRLFVSEFFRSFQTTGAILPSGRALCRALVRTVREQPGPKRILEVGPGTGAVTGYLIDAMHPADRLVLVEINERFVAHLRDRFASDPRFRQVAERTEIFHRAVAQLPADDRYDVIVSALPLNNFSLSEVQFLLGTMLRLLHTGGTLSFFEYIAIRRARWLISRGGERSRLRGIGRVLDELLAKHEVRRDRIWCNIPPAWVHHLRPECRRHTE